VRTADREFKVPPIRVDVVNGLGAGDAFGGALARGLLDGDDLQQVIERANAAGAYVSGRLACADAMPDRVQLDDFMAEAAR
jgi:5-dehydro-2-deoxygluconokinase